MMNKNTAILDNTMMDAYLTVTEGVSDNCGIGLAFASLLESAKKNFVTQSNRRAVNASFAGGSSPICRLKILLLFLLQLLPHCNMN